jgi:outer membrane immunogenic protein
MRIISTAFATIAIGSAAMAADLGLPRFAPPPVPMPAWAGFYLGANAGGGSGTASNDFGFASIELPLKGAIGGAQLGYNWQSGPFVYGLETDFQGSSVKGSISTPCATPSCSTSLTATYQQELPWFGTVRGRIGYADAGWLLYATGGYAYGEVNTNATATAGAASAALSNHTIGNGWTVGAGAELLLAPHWSAKLEYLYVDLGRFTNSYAFPGIATITDTTHPTVNVVRAGVNFHF